MYISHRELEGGWLPHLTDDVRPTFVTASSSTLLNSFPFSHKMDPFKDGDFDPTPSLEDPDVRRYLEWQLDTEQSLARALATEAARTIPWYTCPDDQNIWEPATDPSTCCPAATEYSECHGSSFVEQRLMPELQNHWLQPLRIST